jgi:hypothetical protein
MSHSAAAGPQAAGPHLACKQQRTRLQSISNHCAKDYQQAAMGTQMQPGAPCAANAPAAAATVPAAQLASAATYHRRLQPV